MKIEQPATIGTTGLEIPRLGFGGAPIGGLFANVTEDEADQAVHRALELGLRYLDTAPFYGRGKSELRIGRVLTGFSREEFVISTKVGRLLVPTNVPPSSMFVDPPLLDTVFDYSRDGILRSLEESLNRLGLDRIDILLIHDLDTAEEEDPSHWRKGVQEAYPTLEQLRSEGVIKAIGAGLNNVGPLIRLADVGDFDCFLLAGRYTLLDQSGLLELLPICEERRISVILGGPYNSGILASDLSPNTTYFYEIAPPTVLERAHSIKKICEQFTVPLKAAALQFCLAHPAVSTTIPGARSVREVEDNVEMVEYEIPDELWQELRRQDFIPQSAPIPAGNKKDT